MGQIARLNAAKRRHLQEDAVTLTVSLNWLIRVQGTTDIDEATEIVADYMRDQSDLAESLSTDIADPDDTELTMILYPDDAEVPANDNVPWSTYTYHRTPPAFRRREPAWCGDPALHEPHFTDSATECPGVSGVRPAGPDPRDHWPIDHAEGE